MTDASEVTGRDSYVIAQALYEFIRLEQSKPIAERRGSDERDAKAILHARFDDELELLVQSDEAAGRKPPDYKRKVTLDNTTRIEHHLIPTAVPHQHEGLFLVTPSQ
jgi:hypothetical protein